MHGFAAAILGYGNTAGTSSIHAYGNYLCTSADGTAKATPATEAGVLTGMTTSDVGGEMPWQRNLISGCSNRGIAASGPAMIEGNLIGTDVSGTLPIPAIIGGFGPGEGNVIAFNNGAGIVAGTNALGDSFDTRGNAIFGNHGYRRANLDIGAIGPTPNDAGDADGGANYTQNWPQIVSASQSGNLLTVTYLVDTATANAAYPLRVDFYAGVHGGSGLWLVEDTYPADAAQAQRTAMMMLPDGVQAIPFVAIATDATLHSSEISPPFDVIFADEFE